MKGRSLPRTLTPLLAQALPAVLLATVPAPLYARAGREADARSARGFRVGSGIYLSTSVVLSLHPDGTFRVEELGGSRVAQGRYAAGASLLTFTAGHGDVGRTRFPLKCRVVGVFEGFRVGSGQPACRAFDGLSFRRAN
jgi:hypothetical protein